ncbi:hypothetical protein G6N05_02850 [Flavobacterium sp. F372]|uniref:Uncharacterized protein n=1 Tax=Flavobacterium bernardetii TaxID=2813823 RepID=A0ABR7IVJ1_9FLAO|nr:hypothetical protein [Flavobacterium bernardetii]MBC5833814.1 hypothetical protein [Flavobacterium bernardetii]NHF69047.1 hypothetical protein [Flavobacterium bernardetii]
MLENKLKINLLGEAWKLKQVVFFDALLHTFDEVATKMKQPLNKVLIDPFFYHYLNNKTIQSIDDLQGNCFEGLINSPKNQIEIWYKNKKVQKLKINDLKEELLLFPLYKTIIQKTNLQLEKGIYIEQKEIGLIGSFEIYTDNFSIDDLEFQLLQTNEQTILEKLIYKNQVLVCKKKDSLLTFQNCFEI